MMFPDSSILPTLSGLTAGRFHVPSIIEGALPSASACAAWELPDSPVKRYPEFLMNLSRTLLLLWADMTCDTINPFPVRKYTRPLMVLAWLKALPWPNQENA
jgi:hypothetical protein